MYADILQQKRMVVNKNKHTTLEGWRGKSEGHCGGILTNDVHDIVN